MRTRAATASGLVVLVVLAAGLVSCGSGEGDQAGTEVTIEAAEPATTPGTDAASPPSTERVEFATGTGAASAVGFRPVLLVTPGDGGDPTYELGEVVLDGGGVERASAVTDPSGGWRVLLVLTDDGIGTFNEVASECYDRSPRCPTGQMAIEVDGEVVSAPTIQTPTFERDRIQVTGEPFDRAEAEAVARAVSAAAGGS